MLIAGVDCSSKNIAITVLTTDKLLREARYIESNLKNMDMRLSDLVLQFEGLGIFEAEEPITFLAVENPVYLSNPKASSGIAQVIGYVKSVAARHNVNFLGIDNRSWKKSVLGNGAADKDMIMKFSQSNWGKDAIYNQDLADSACVALWGVMRII
jgi:Holliday junction resolvasome RuvABC endonuclease subunit